MDVQEVLVVEGADGFGLVDNAAARKLAIDLVGDLGQAAQRRHWCVRVLGIILKISLNMWDFGLPASFFWELVKTFRSFTFCSLAFRALQPNVKLRVLLDSWVRSRLWLSSQRDNKLCTLQGSWLLSRLRLNA